MFSGFNYVIGFIVVSGYCIARSTLEHRFNLARYAARRVTRIYPSLIAGALLAGLVEACWLDSPNRIAMWDTGIDPRIFAWNAAGLAGFSAQFGSYAPTYTVAYELFYYAIWGLLLSIMPQRRGPLAMALAMPALFFLLPSNFQFAVVLSAVWITGAALAIYQKEILLSIEEVPLWLVWLSCLLIFILGNSEIMRHKVNFWAAPGSLWTIPCGFLFAIVIASHLARRGPELALDKWLGKISYPLFLFHGPIIIAIGSLTKASHIRFSFGALFFILMACSIVVARAVVVLIERPLMDWRKSRKSSDEIHQSSA